MFEAKKYKLISKEIDAAQITSENASLIASWCGGEVTSDPLALVSRVTITYPHYIFNTQVAIEGDWIARREDGKFMHFADDTFAEHYEVV